MTNKGKAVIDCGATKSLGGINALEKLAKRNARKYGETRMALDLEDCPTFTFGNGRRAKVNGRATFEIEENGNGCTIDIHGLDAKGVPILVSIDTLARMGAVIDFKTGRAIYQELRPTQIVQLERSTTGHLLMDLAEDLYKDSISPGPADTPLLRLARGSSTGNSSSSHAGTAES